MLALLLVAAAVASARARFTLRLDPRAIDVPQQRMTEATLGADPSADYGPRCAAPRGSQQSTQYSAPRPQQRRDRGGAHSSRSVASQRRARRRSRGQRRAEEAKKDHTPQRAELAATPRPRRGSLRSVTATPRRGAATPRRQRRRDRRKAGVATAPRRGEIVERPASRRRRGEKSQRHDEATLPRLPCREEARPLEEVLRPVVLDHRLRPLRYDVPGQVPQRAPAHLVRHEKRTLLLLPPRVLRPAARPEQRDAPRGMNRTRPGRDADGPRPGRGAAAGCRADIPRGRVAAPPRSADLPRGRVAAGRRADMPRGRVVRGLEDDAGRRRRRRGRSDPRGRWRAGDALRPGGLRAAVPRRARRVGPRRDVRRDAHARRPDPRGERRTFATPSRRVARFFGADRAATPPRGGGRGADIPAAQAATWACPRPDGPWRGSGRGSPTCDSSFWSSRPRTASCRTRSRPRSYRGSRRRYERARTRCRGNCTSSCSTTATSKSSRPGSASSRRIGSC